MRPYEIMIIFDASLEDGVMEQIVGRVTDQIRAGGDTPGRVDRWGKRRFAYELDHHSEGYYILVEATAEPGSLDDVHRMLSLSDEVLRHKVIRLPDEAAGGSPAPTPEGGTVAEAS
ncbi:MAG: 30S ribosomal protein S6 [Thermoplasmata archaeon]